VSLSAFVFTWLVYCAQVGEPAATEESEPETLAFKEPPEIQAALAELLQTPEFRRLRPPDKAVKKDEEKKPGWLERLLDRLFKDSKRESAPREGIGVAPLLVSLATWVLYGIVGLAFAAVVFWIVKSLLERGEGKSREDRPGRPGAGQAVLPSTPPGEQPAEEYLREALRLGRAGKHREAIRQLLLGTMSWIERNGLIRYRKGLGNRDYLRAVWQQPQRRDPLSALILAFDQIYFGRRPATAERFEECLTHYRSGFSSP